MNNELPQALIHAIESALTVDTSKVTHEGFTKKGVACPAKTHQHDDESPAAYWHVEKHFLKCFKCNETFNAHQTAEHLGIDWRTFYEDRKPAEDTRRPFESLADYAQAHGVHEDVFTAAGWHETTHYGRSAIAFPVIDSGGTEWTRYRFTDGGKQKYTNQDGFKACWYGMRRAIHMARTNEDPIVICNGEASTVVAQHFGIPAIARSSGEQKLGDDLIDELRNVWNGRVIIALDCDDKGRASAAAIAAQLSDMEIAIKDLGLTNGGDLADFCKLYTRDAKIRLMSNNRFQKPNLDMIATQALADAAAALRGIQQAQRTGAEQEVKRLSQRMRRELDRLDSVTQRPVLVDSLDAAAMARARNKRIREGNGAIAGLTMGFPTLDYETGGLQEETVTVVYGATSMGKTVFITSVIAHLMHVYRDLTALVLSTETSVAKYQNRIAGSALGIPYSKINKSYLLSAQEYDLVDRKLAGIGTRRWQFLDGVSPSLESIRSAVLDAIKERGIQLVIIDSLSNLYSADDYSKVAMYSNGILALARETKLPFLVSSQVGRDVSKRGHNNKTPTLPDGYGGGVLENNAENVIALYRHDYYVRQGTEQPDESMGEDVGIATLLKCRDGEMGRKVALTWDAGSRYTERPLPSRRLEDV